VATTKFRSEARARARGLLRAAAIGALAVLLLLGCKARSGPSPAPSAVPPPPPAPAGLVAELVAPSPATLYGSLRALVASRTPLLPESPELALATVLGLPPQAAAAVLLDRPLVGAAVAQTAGPELSFVVACRVKSGAELAVVLAGRGAPRPGAPALGVVDDWLIVANDAAAASAVGPYVARVLGARPPPAEALTVEVRETALRGAVISTLRAKWSESRAALSALAAQARKSAGRPADFGDPEAMLLSADERVASLLGLLESSRRLGLTLTSGEGRVTLGVELEPAPGGAAEKVVQSLPVGDLAPLLALPGDTVAGVLLRTNEAELETLADESDAGASGPFWSRLTPKDAAALRRALGQAAKGYGTTTAFGLLRNKAFVLESSLRDAAAFQAAAPELTRALRLPPLRDAFGALLGKLDPRESVVKLPGLDSPLHRVTLAPARPPEKSTEWWWGIRGRTLLVVSSAEPSATFATLLQEPAAETLARNTALAGMVERRAKAALAFYADLAVLDAAAVPAPALFVYGRRERSMRLELELSNAAASQLLARTALP
jgi:hypothetical protein